MIRRLVYLNPSVAMTPSPQKVKFLGCVAPMTSEKCVSHSACFGKSLGCVCGDHRPSNTIWKEDSVAYLYPSLVEEGFGHQDL